MSASSWNNEAALGIGEAGDALAGVKSPSQTSQVPLATQRKAGMGEAPARNVWWTSNNSRKSTTASFAPSLNENGNSSRRTSSSSVMGAGGETEDLYCDDELHPWYTHIPFCLAPTIYGSKGYLIRKQTSTNKVWPNSYAIMGRAWDKVLTAKVESSHGRI